MFHVERMWTDFLEWWGHFIYFYRGYGDIKWLKRVFCMENGEKMGGNAWRVGVVVKEGLRDMFLKGFDLGWEKCAESVRSGDGVGMDASVGEEEAEVVVTWKVRGRFFLGGKRVGLVGDAGGVEVLAGWIKEAGDVMDRVVLLEGKVGDADRAKIETLARNRPIQEK